MRRAVLDTNVLASGFSVHDSIPDRLLRLWLTGAWELIVSAPIIAEFERTFEKRYFQARLSTRQPRENIGLLRRRATLVSITAQVSGVATHLEDDVILSVAVSARAQYLVTGDERFRRQVPSYQGVQFISPREFLELLVEEAQRGWIP
ncbi:MAG: putative toxin-antitoxin system toxin component, PIN family [Chloroflexota bacterium]